MNIYDLISRAQGLRQETKPNSVSPGRVGTLFEDILKYINEFQPQSSLSLLHKTYASVSAMQADAAPKSDLTGKALMPGQLVVIVPASQSDATAGDLYRYDGPSGNTSAWTFISKIGGVPADAKLDATSVNPVQNKVVTEKFTELSVETNRSFLLSPEFRYAINVVNGQSNDRDNGPTKLPINILANEVIYVRCESLSKLTSFYMYLIFEDNTSENIGQITSYKEISYRAEKNATGIGFYWNSEEAIGNGADYIYLSCSNSGVKKSLYDNDVPKLKEDVSRNTAMLSKLSKSKTSISESELLTTDIGRHYLSIGVADVNWKIYVQYPAASSIYYDIKNDAGEVVYSSPWSSEFHISTVDYPDATTVEIVYAQSIPIESIIAKSVINVEVNEYAISMRDIAELTNIPNILLELPNVTVLAEGDYTIRPDFNNDGNDTYVYNDVVITSVAENENIWLQCNNIKGEGVAQNSVVIHSVKNGENHYSQLEAFSLSALQKGVMYRLPTNNDYDAICVTLYPTITGSITEVTYEGLKIYKTDSNTIGVRNDYLPDRFDVPAYYLKDNYLDNKVIDILDTMAAANGDVDAFIFCTDQHWLLNAKNSPKLINYLSRRLPLSRLFMGGDMADGINIDCIKAFKDAFDGKIYNVVGNHEYMDYYCQDGVQINKSISDGIIWAALNAHMTDAVVGKPSEQYYYVDNPCNKMRYIVLSIYADGSEARFSSDQASWLENVALDAPSGYTIVVMAHAVLNDNKTPISSELMSILESYNGDAPIAAIIQGHSHFDFSATTKNGIPIVAVNCDKYIFNTQYENPSKVERVIGTRSEQCFDVIVVNKQNRKVSFIRIGVQALTNEGERVDVREFYY